MSKLTPMHIPSTIPVSGRYRATQRQGSTHHLLVEPTNKTVCSRKVSPTSWVTGTGNKPLCKWCNSLNDQTIREQ